VLSSRCGSDLFGFVVSRFALCRSAAGSDGSVAGSNPSTAGVSALAVKC
jgi:hypothetical protein